MIRLETIALFGMIECMGKNYYKLFREIQSTSVQDKPPTLYTVKKPYMTEVIRRPYRRGRDNLFANIRDNR